MIKAGDVKFKREKNPTTYQDGNKSEKKH